MLAVLFLHKISTQNKGTHLLMDENPNSLNNQLFSIEAQHLSIHKDASLAHDVIIDNLVALYQEKFALHLCESLYEHNK